MRIRPRSRIRGDTSSLRHALRVSHDTHLVAVLNGRDEILEAFWGWGKDRRIAFLHHLRNLDVRVVTGPTFSITGSEPASHSAYMLARHHTVVQEIACAGLLAVPNLYWRNPRDLRDWAIWLRANPDVVIISRDFSRTKHRTVFLQELRYLIRIIRSTARPFHVLLVGTGPQ